MKKINKRRGKKVFLSPNIVRKKKSTGDDHKVVVVRNKEKKVIKR
mgnify:CR=1 FL=1